MGRIRRCGFLALLLVSFFNGRGLASEIKKADELFDKGTFQEALKGYESVFKETTDEETRWKAFFRICESLAHLFRYGEAAQRLTSTPLPDNMPYRVRILILRAEMFRNFLQQYAYIQRTDVIDDEEKEVFRLTPEEIKDEIQKAYQELWGLREELLKLEIRDEGYLLDIREVDFGMYPTLFDYLILSWTDFLFREAAYATEDVVRPKAELFLVEEFKPQIDLEDPPVLLIAGLIGEASRTEGEGRLEARERWKIRRLLLPLRYSSLIDLKELAEDKTIYDDKDVKECRRQTKEILLKWKDSLKAREARAEARYETALILQDDEQPDEAVKLCREIEREFSGTYASRLAKTLRSGIEMPELILEAKTVMPPGQEAFTVTTRNLEKVYFRLYRIDPHGLKGHHKNFNGYASILNYPDEDWLKGYLPLQTLYKAWGFETGDKGDYKMLKKTIDPPALTAGVYLVLACADKSFKIGSSLISACFLNVTDLVLVGTGGFTTKCEDAYYDFIDKEAPSKIKDEGFHFYTLNAKTGKPIEKAGLNVYAQLNAYSYDKKEKKFYNLSTDKEGSASLSLPVDVSPQAYYNNYQIDPLAKYRDSFSYWPNSQYLNYSAPRPIQLFIETDRPIYRPGDKVQAKAVVLRDSSQGYRTIGSGKTITFCARDPNSKDFFTKEAEVNDFGSASLDFEIPTGRLLGRYNLEARCEDGRFSNDATVYFSVEEYKRPEFELLLKPAEAPWNYNQPVEIKGEAKYYFGGPVPDAAIKYRIKRQPYIPWCYRYWFGENYSSYGQEIASGDARTDVEGNFIINFTPTPQPYQYSGQLPDITEFTVEVEGRDSGGRTIEGQQSYKAGKNGIYFVIEPKKGFFLERETLEIESKRLTINDTPAQGTSSYEVFRLAKAPAKSLEELGYGYRGYWGWVPPLDIQLKDTPNGPLVAKGEVEHDKDGKSIISLQPLVQGTYRVTQKTKDQWGKEVKQDKIFVVAKDTKGEVPVDACSVMLVEKDEYKVGDRARFLIGSGLAGGFYHIEVWAGRHFLSHRLIGNNRPVQLIEVPVTERMKGGFTLRWFGVKELNFHYGQTTVSVPWNEKKLKIGLEPFDKELKPGEEVSWGIKVDDAEARPVIAEVLALMYDRSLEYYIKQKNLWLDNLYRLRPAPELGNDSVFDPYAMSLRITEGLLKKILDAFRQAPEGPRLPGLRISRTWAKGGFWETFEGRVDGSGLLDLDEEEKRGDFSRVFTMNAGLDPCESVQKEGVSVSKQQEAAKQVEARKAFADTAFFKPHIITAKDGRGKFSFKAPEQLTSWRIKAFAFTKDAREGTVTSETVTRKDLMVRVDLPRFFREKDRGTITAIVHNESDQDLEGELFIEVTEYEELINEKIKLGDNKKSFLIKPHSLATFNWIIEIPFGVTTYKVRAAAVSEKLTDAEERDLPILPSRQRLIESVFAALTGSESKKLEILLKEDPTRINESMLLQIDPQLALSILNTIPFLIEYPYECVEQILNKYVPLSVVNEIYKKYPAIKKAVSKIPKRDTVTPPWEKDDPRRLIKLMETPWVWQSEGQPGCCPVIDLLDPKIVEAQKRITFNKLKSAQLSNGAFPWWPGGQADPYMSLYVLAGLAEARRYGVEVDKDMLQRALGYVNKEIPLLLKAEERYLALVSYAAYVVTSFSPEEFSQAKKGLQAARAWVEFLERHIHAMTPLGKAYLAYTYLRLGNKERAEEVLDMAMDGAREDPIAGVYWTPEKYSWVWYSDTVEKHAFFLRTLQELRPEDKRILGMVQWLLFNRKGTVWKSTKASTAAVYALLDYLNQRGALAGDERFKVRWGKDVYSAVVRADDWLEEPIRWQELGFDIAEDKSSATIEKEGPGLAFASLTWTYSTDQLPEASAPGMLEVERRFYRRVKEAEQYHLKPINSGEKVYVGDQIEVQLKINTRSQFEYMHLKDPKVAGFEAETLLSGWKYDPLSFYEEPRDSLTNFFMSWLPHGEYILRYRLRPTKPGLYRVGAATLQSMYAPEMTAHSTGFIIEVAEE